jgi:hypothetical protein
MTRSQLNWYDELARLIKTEVGELAYSGGEPQISSLLRRDTWTLDLLGNWVGGAATRRSTVSMSMGG